MMTGVLLVATSLFTSCEGDKNTAEQNVSAGVSQITNCLSAEDDIIIRLSADEFLASAGCELDGSEIELSPVLQQLFENELTGAEQREFFDSYALLRECIDINQVYLVFEDYSQLSVYDDDNIEGVFCYALILNKEKAKEFLFEMEGVESRTQSDYEVISISGQDVFIIKDDVLFCGVGEDLEGDYIRRTKRAVNAPLSGVSGDILSAFDSNSTLVCYVSMDNIYRYEYNNADPEERAMYDLQRSLFPFDIMDSKALMVAQLDKSDMTVEISYYKDGNRVALMPNAANINTNLLKYLSKEQIFVLATSMYADIDFLQVAKEMPQYKESDAQTRAGINLVATYLNKIDGDIIIAVGPRDALFSYTNPSAQNWSATLLVKFESGVAQEIFDLLYEQFQYSFLDITRNGADAEVRLPNMDATIYAGVREDCLIVSFNPIDEATGCAYDSNLFSGVNTRIVAGLEQGDALLSSIGIDNMATNANLGVDDSCAKLVWSIDNDSKPFVESVLEALLQMSQSAEYQEEAYDEDFYNQFIDAVVEEQY